MDEYKKAIELCEKYTNGDNGWEMKATLHDTLTLRQVEENNIAPALDYHQQALKIMMEHIDTNDPLLASYHNNVAISCNAAGQQTQAIEHYRIAIDLELSSLQPDYANVAYSYESMGDIFYYYFKNYAEALSCYEPAREIMLRHLPLTHPDIFSIHESMANTYEKLNELDKSLEILDKCLDTIQKSSERSHHNLLMTYRHIHTIYKQQKRFEKASVILKQCHELEVICSQSEDLQLNHVNLESAFDEIFRINTIS